MDDGLLLLYVIVKSRLFLTFASTSHCMKFSSSGYLAAVKKQLVHVLLTRLTASKVARS